MPRFSRSRASRLIFVSAYGLAGFGCSGDSPTAPPAPPPPPRVASVVITAPAPDVAEGKTIQLSAETKDSTGTTVSGRSISWSSGTPEIATVSSTGLVTAISRGTATIIATSENVQGTFALTVKRAAVSSVTVKLQSDRTVAGGKIAASATATDANGKTVTDLPVTWQSSNTSIATVDASGLVTTRSPGTVSITAIVGEAQGSASLESTFYFIQNIRVGFPAEVDLNDNHRSVAVVQGRSVQATAICVADSTGFVDSSVNFSWKVSHPGLLEISSTGLVRTIARGDFVIIATADRPCGTHQHTEGLGGVHVFLGPPARIEKLSGDGQSTRSEESYPNPFVVRVVDSVGSPIAGIVLNFFHRSGDLGGSNCSGTSDAAGIVSCTLRARTQIGVDSISVSGQLLDRVFFTGNVLLGPPAYFRVVQGDEQYARQGTFVAADPTVSVHDNANRPLPGIPVTFAISAGDGSVGSGSAKTLVVNSDANGLAAIAWRMGTPGTNRLAASLEGGTTLNFSATSVNTEWLMQKLAGDQRVSPGFEVTIRPSVKLTDINGSPVVGATVMFEVTGGGGSVTGATQITDSQGIATVGSWKAGPTQTVNTLRAFSSRSNDVVFTGNGLP
jgi:hypothetical protein